MPTPAEDLAKLIVWGPKPADGYAAPLPDQGRGPSGNGFGAFPGGNIPLGANGFGSRFPQGPQGSGPMQGGGREPTPSRTGPLVPPPGPGQGAPRNGPPVMGVPTGLPGGMQPISPDVLDRIRARVGGNTTGKPVIGNSGGIDPGTDGQGGWGYNGGRFDTGGGGGRYPDDWLMNVMQRFGMSA